MRRSVQLVNPADLSPEEVARLFTDKIAKLERENQELRANVARLANENNELCDRLFEAERINTMQREAAAE